ncbi:hypothetical protein [Dyadobacter sp. NIV53]|uniref:hypothetical protein n=1 Tax=Dyadobacter sp. NIV53 TaxID=2861765 RepID=UPI001C86D303|nr:hypothetical protein [Dyadobacter sp. NIV53]
MKTFSSIKELLVVLNREHKLIIALFEKRKSLAYKYDHALELVDFDEDKIRTLIHYSVIRQNGNNLELDDQFLQFFEQILEVNEEINVSYINEHIQNIKHSILYYLQENSETRKYGYLRQVKNALRKIGIIALRNVVDLNRNIDNTFKHEPNYKIKKAKLEHLDDKRHDIYALIGQTEQLISGEEEQTFFKVAADEELNRIIIVLRLQLNECLHNLIDIQKQIIEFLNRIKYHSGVIEKLRQIKYLKDQFTLKSKTNIKEILAVNNAVIFEPNPVYPLKISLEVLQTDNEIPDLIGKISKRIRTGIKVTQPLAGSISNEDLETQVEEEFQINLDEVKNGFLAGSNNLFDFVLNYNFDKEVSFDERITIYCQMVSQYDALFKITDLYNSREDTEFAMIYPK